MTRHEQDHEHDPDRDLDAARGDAEREAEREGEREGRRAERHAEREARRAEREAARGTRRELRRMRWYFGLGDLGVGLRSDLGETAEVVERRFTVAGMPRLRIRNVSGETTIAVGQGGEVSVRARKRVHGASEDRAKRLLENVEIRMEQSGDDILVEPRLYEQERGWSDLFRGGRVRVDFDVRVPREAEIDATTVSGDLSVTGTRGPLEARSVSGDVAIDGVQGPLRLRTVSGDARASAYAGQLEGNSVSGDLRFERSRVRVRDIVTVSGDVEIEAALVGSAGEGRVKTVSGDVELAFGEGAFEIEYKTVSGDADVDRDLDAQVEKVDRRDRRIAVGRGGQRIRVKTVSGDLTVRRSGEEGAAEEPGEAIPMGAPADADPKADVMDVLERLARGELSVEEAATALDGKRT